MGEALGAFGRTEYHQLAGIHLSALIVTHTEMLVCLDQECFQLEGLLKAWGAVLKWCCGHWPLWSLCSSEQQRASLAPSEVSKQRKGKRMHSHLWHFLNAHLLWTERKLFLIILVKADLQRWYAVFFLLLCTWEIDTDADAGRDEQGMAGFQQRDVLVEVKEPL